MRILVYYVIYLLYTVSTHFNFISMFTLFTIYVAMIYNLGTLILYLLFFSISKQFSSTVPPPPEINGNVRNAPKMRSDRF